MAMQSKRAGTSLKLVTVDEYKKQPRRHRRPREAFNIKARPFEIVPFLCHPVLPMETLDSAFLQSAVVSDPVANRLIGWWHEYHIFYVPIRALTQGPDFQIDPADLNSLFLDPTFTMNTSYTRGSNTVPFYSFKGGVSWVNMLYSYIVARWFRDEGEGSSADTTWDDYDIAQVDQKNWAHSLKEESATGDDTELPGVDELEDLDILSGFETHYAQYELMRDQGMIDMTYREFLRSYGITPPKDLVVAPDAEAVPTLEAERLRSIVKFTQPTLAPQVGSANTSSVLYWRCAERITKRRFFGEPGFIFGVTVTRPKLYLGNQKGHAVGLLHNAFAWLPAVLNHLPYTSIQENLDSATDGILQGGDEDYWLDIKDMFLHGGQFVNHAMSASANHGVAIPVVSDLNKKYISEAMMNSLFTTSDGSASYIIQDGSVHFDILGKLVEGTPGTGTAN